MHGIELHGIEVHGIELHGIELHGIEVYGIDVYGIELHGIEVYGIEVYGIEVYGIEVYGIEVHGIEVYGIEVYGIEVYGIEVYGIDSCCTCKGVDTSLLPLTATKTTIASFEPRSLSLGLSDHLGREVSRGGDVYAEGLGAGTGRQLVQHDHLSRRGIDRWMDG